LHFFKATPLSVPDVSYLKIDDGISRVKYPEQRRMANPNIK